MMAEPDKRYETRAEGHYMDSSMDQDLDTEVEKGSHCHACWKYTDDMRRDGDLIHEAVGLVASSSVLAVEKSEAFQAADKYLAARFKQAEDKIVKSTMSSIFGTSKSDL